MLKTIYIFELKYRYTRLENYIYFIAIFLFSLIAFDFIFEGQDLGQVNSTSPYIIAKVMAITSGFFMFVTSMIMGVPILRDFEHKTQAMLFVNPISKIDYFLGRFLGSFTILLLVFTALPLGMMLGEFLPWRDGNIDHIIKPISYLRPFIYFLLPSFIISGSVFFVSGALTRKMIVVYTQGIAFLLITLIALSLKNEIYSVLLEPLSYAALDYISVDWTIPEMNNKEVPLAGVLLINRLFWLLFGIGVFIWGLRKFEFNILQEGSSGKLEKTSEGGTVLLGEVPYYTHLHGLKPFMVQLLHHAIFNFKLVFREASFWAIVGCGAVIIAINSISLGTSYGVDSYPSSFLILEELKEMALYFFLIILVFYPGEVIFKEKTLGFNDLSEVTGLSRIIPLSGKLLGLCGIYGFLLLCLMLAGIVFQVSNAYFDINIPLYVFSLFGEVFPFLAIFTSLSFLINVLFDSKYLGHIIFITIFVVNMALSVFGLGHGLYSIGGIGITDYSEMNGFGRFLLPYSLFKTYWLLWSVLIFGLAVYLDIRSWESNPLKRFISANKNVTPKFKVFLLGTFGSFILLGLILFYNTVCLNPSFSQKQKNQFRSDYEIALKKFEYVDQAQLVDVKLSLNLYPQKQKYEAKGDYTLKNKSKSPIDEVLVQRVLSGDDVLESLSVNRSFSVDSSFIEFGMFKILLDSSLQVEDSLKLSFVQSLNPKGIKEDDKDFGILKNGTFFDNSRLPSIGYNSKYELQDNEIRKEYGLPSLSGLAKQEDSKELRNSRRGDDGSCIRFEAIISTSDDQIALAPGRLISESHSNARKFYHYKMDKPMINFYSITSARYEKLEDIWHRNSLPKSEPVDLEIYYDEKHDFNIDRMMKAMKSTLTFFEESLTSYQYDVLRIMEYPRYREFAQSFPTSIPFSEGLGFVLDLSEEGTVDIPFFITAHEVAHQWWGLNLLAANVQGRNLILETLAQYSALMVLKGEYGEEMTMDLLATFKANYENGKRTDANDEKALYLVEKEDYLYYDKGALAMYELQRIVGSETVNKALKNFLLYQGGLELDSSRNSFSTSIDLLHYLRSEIEPDLQEVVDELFLEVWQIGDCYEIDVSE